MYSISLLWRSHRIHVLYLARMKIQLSSNQTKYLRTLVQGDLESLTELRDYEKLEKCYQCEYAAAREVAELLGAKLGNLPEKLTATAAQAAEALAEDKAEIAELERTGLPRWMR